MININASTGIDKVTVYDILGREVLRQNGDTVTMNINMSALTSGSYLAQVQSGGRTQVIKLIKQ